MLPHLQKLYFTSEDNARLQQTPELTKSWFSPKALHLPLPPSLLQYLGARASSLLGVVVVSQLAALLPVHSSLYLLQLALAG